MSILVETRKQDVEPWYGSYDGFPNNKACWYRRQKNESGSQGSTFTASQALTLTGAEIL
jgi:hypothetical protein